MRCWILERKLTPYVEDAVSDHERSQVLSHLRSCRACAVKVQSQRRMRSSLRGLPRLEMPSDLAIRLRVLASKEQWVDGRRSNGFEQWRQRIELRAHELMKPLALPAAGGLCSAVLFFMMLIPALSTFTNSIVEDVPLWALSRSTAATVRSMAPIGFQDGDAEVDLRIDGQGRIINYSIVGRSGQQPDALRRSIENSLLFTTFTPATSQGVPISGTLRLSFRSSHIDVKG